MKKVLFSILGSELDKGFNKKRWERWRPSVSLGYMNDLGLNRLELIYQEEHLSTAKIVKADLESISAIEVVLNPVSIANPWDFEEVYSSLFDYIKAYPLKPDQEEYLVNITTGTHVCQICMFLLTEAHYFPGRLLQLSPIDRRTNPEGSYQIIDLDLSKYDRLVKRFEYEKEKSLNYLKLGIATKNDNFNKMIEELELVSSRSKAPILLTGPTGAGKTQLARRIFELKRIEQGIKGDFVQVNCATLRGDIAMSTLFGHKKGAFTGALNDRKGLLLAADKGLLFLDEIGELGLDEQAMLLRAIEDKSFTPMGDEKEQHSDFQLICGTNRDLLAECNEGRFRSDLLARIELWSFKLPSLKDRLEDIEPNLDYELSQFREKEKRQLTMNKDARQSFMTFAKSSEAKWNGNFRDLNAAITRMGTLSLNGRIAKEQVENEINRLKIKWTDTSENDSTLLQLFSEEALSEIDLFDQFQLSEVIKLCRQCKTMSEAGRQLYAISRKGRKQINDSDRLKKYLAKFNLTWSDIHR